MDGFSGTLHFVFTLPVEVEAKPLYDKALQKRLIDGIQNIVRVLFGKNKKSRSNIHMNISVHPVGDNDIFRDRWHVHVDIIPAEIAAVNDKETKEFIWLTPIAEATGLGHTDQEWKLNLCWLGDRWNELLAKIFGKNLYAIQPQTEFIPASPNASFWEWRLNKRPLEEGQTFDDVYFAKIGHKLKYSMRSFAQDIENVILRTDVAGKRVVIKAGNYDQKEKKVVEYWRLIDIDELISRFMFIREHNIVRARGWGQCLSKYQDILDIKDDDDGDDLGDMPTAYAVEGTRKMIREKVYDKEKKKIIWRREEIYLFDCPITRKKREINKNDMKRWLWKGDGVNT